MVTYQGASSPNHTAPLNVNGVTCSGADFFFTVNGDLNAGFYYMVSSKAP